MKKLLLFPIVAGLLVQANAATITWTGGGDSNQGGNWSVTGDWSSGTAPGSSDTALLSDVTSGGRTIIYDSNASGSLLELSITQSTNALSNILQIQRNLIVTNAIVLGATSGTAEIDVAPPGASTVTLTALGGVTVNSGGLFSLNFGTSNSGYSLYTGGTITLAGGTLRLGQSPSTVTSYTTLNSDVVVSSGAISIVNTGGTDNRLKVNGNFTATGGSISTTTGVGGTLILGGATNSITNFSLGSISLTLDRASDQSLSIDSAAGLVLRGAGNTIKTITSTGTGTQIGTIYMIQGSAGSTTGLKLGSNLTVASGGALPYAASSGQATDVIFQVDLNGHTLDGTSKGSSWTLNKGNATTATWNLTSSAADGVVKMRAYDFSGSGITSNIAAGVTMIATGGNSWTNNLSGTGTIDPSSSFVYSGGAALSTPSLLVSNRTLGKVKVTGSSALKVSTYDLTAAGTVTVQDTGSILDLGGKILTLTGGASLSGNGTITSSASGGAITFTGTGGISLASSESLSLSGSFSTSGLTLAATSASNFGISSLTSYGILDLAGVAITYAGSLYLDFGSTTWSDGTYTFDLFQNEGTVSGSFTSITGSLSLATYDFDAATGIVTVVVVPEPSTYALMVLAGMTMFYLGRAKNNSSV